MIPEQYYLDLGITFKTIAYGYLIYLMCKGANIMMRGDNNGYDRKNNRKSNAKHDTKAN